MRSDGYNERLFKILEKCLHRWRSWQGGMRKFEWNDKCEGSFQDLKRRLTSTSMLILPDDKGKFVFYKEASHKELGDVLMWHDKVITYTSRQLKLYERKYPTHTVERTTIVFADVNGMERSVRFTQDHKSEVYCHQERTWYETTTTIKSKWRLLLHYPRKAKV